MKYKKLYTVVGMVVVLVLLPLLSFSYYKYALNRPAQGHKEATFEILDGEPVNSVSERLYAEELINSSFLFKAHLISQGLHTKIQAGIYRIPAGSSAAELSLLFQHGTNDFRITFLEGWRVEEYARVASEEFKRVDYEDFVSLARDREGILFPDTYFFSSEVTEEEMIDELSVTFEEKTALSLKDNKLTEIGLTKEEAIIFASIVEREVYNEVDRPMVAGILIKRWKNGELIGADATTQYAVAELQLCNPDLELFCPEFSKDAYLSLDWWPTELTLVDLSSESPYNTRKNVGLPPKPISNPGLSAIESVMNYIETSANYYLTDENGVTHYANTLEEHNRNIVLYL